MKLTDAFDVVSKIRPAWRGKTAWNPPFCYNRAHILRLLGPDKEVNRITKRDLLEMRAELLEEPGNKGSTRSAGGVNRIMSMMNTLMSELVELEILDAYPKLKPLKETNTRKNFYSRSQFERMVQLAVDVYGDQELAEAIQFAVYTGCRQGELLDLKIEDIDIENKLLTFRETKNGDDHIIDIHPDLMGVLKWRVVTKRPEDKAFDFSSDDELRRKFYKVRDLVGLDDEFCWHTLRHTTATWLVDRGVPLQTIAAVLNHKTLQTTERYAKVSNHARKSAIDLL